MRPLYSPLQTEVRAEVMPPRQDVPDELVLVFHMVLLPEGLTLL
jgi:hypothetical protein